MKGFIIKNIKTGKVYTGKVEYVDNPNWQENTWEYRDGYGHSFGGFSPNLSQMWGGANLGKPLKTLKQVTEKDKEQWPLFYKKEAWTNTLQEYTTPFGSDGTNGPPWMKRISNYWGENPKVFANQKAAQKILSTITKTYYKDRENPTTALLYLPDVVHDYKIVPVELIIRELEDGTGVATTSSESETT